MFGNHAGKRLTPLCLAHLTFRKQRSPLTAVWHFAAPSSAPFAPAPFPALLVALAVALTASFVALAVPLAASFVPLAVPLAAFPVALAVALALSVALAVASAVALAVALAEPSSVSLRLSPESVTFGSVLLASSVSLELSSVSLVPVSVLLSSSLDPTGAPPCSVEALTLEALAFSVTLEVFEAFAFSVALEVLSSEAFVLLCSGGECLEVLPSEVLALVLW
mmetsp:Transcript_13634/g.37514  ORF Transcript_13634/g.37514 Transcript_13634/m.37514 type:complete len:222 (+) Transcript_13634:191-856(+)